MGSTLIRRQRMNFIDDHGTHGLQQAPAFIRREQDEERLRRGDEDMWRTLEHLLPIRHRCIACPDQDPQFRHQQAVLQRHLPDFRERFLEIFLDVIAQCLERRDIENPRMVVEFAIERLLKELIDAGKKGREGLA